MIEEATDGQDLTGVAVPGNDWRTLSPPGFGQWTPQEFVSVIIPAYDCQEELDRTLAGLEAQRYARERLQVVVVDDGSDPPLRAGEGSELDVKLCRVRRTGFAAGRARNAGADVAEGEILVFLDADLVPEPWYVEAHARWHMVTDHAVTLGYRRFVAFDEITPDAIRSATSDGEVADLLRGRTQQPHEWVENVIESTQDLTAVRNDLFRAVVGAGLGVRRQLFAEVGGFHEFGIRGIEDTELGYRLFTAGAVLIPERKALSWHQGTRTMAGADRERIKRQRAPHMANHIPVRPYRTSVAGRSYAVPKVAVTVPLGDERAEEIVGCVESLLGSACHDLHVWLPNASAHHEAELLTAHFAPEPRVTVGEQPAVASPYQLTVPAHVRLSPSAVDNLLSKLDGLQVGSVHATVPGAAPQEGLVELVATRALRRVERLDTAAEHRDALIGDLFGERWLDGRGLGLIGDPGEDGSSGEQGDQSPSSDQSPSKEHLAVELAEARAQLERLRSRKILRLANRVGRLRRKGFASALASRSPYAHRALRRFARAWRRLR